MLTVGLARAITSLSASHSSSSGVQASLPVWANLVQYLPTDGGGVEVKALPLVSCLSRRAVTSVWKFGARLGLVANVDGSLQLTPAGVEARSSWAPDSDDDDDAAALRSLLVPVVAGLALEHPHFPTQYGTADSSLTGGPGQDWKPVPRRGGVDEVVSLSLAALVSQAFVSLAISYERVNGALGWSANVCALVPDEGCSLSSLPASAGRVVSGMERHRWIDRSSEGVITLTPIGARVRDRHASTLAGVEGAMDPDGSLAAAVSAFVDGRPDRLDLERVVHPATYAAFGLQQGRP